MEPAMENTEQPYDLLILTDATASMNHYLRALNTSLPEIIRISSLTGCFDRVSVVAYRDYCGGDLTEWSGWYRVGADAQPENVSGEKSTTREELLAFCKNLKADYGGDWPEATKTGLALAYEKMRSDAKTIVLLYTDAPPHMPCTYGKNREREQANLSKKENFSGHGSLFVDWVSAANTLRSGEKKAQVFSIVQSHLTDTVSPYMYLAERTGGRCFQIHSGAGADHISKITLETLLAWMGVEKEATTKYTRAMGSACRYLDVANIAQAKSEEDNIMKTYLVMQDKKEVIAVVDANWEKVDVNVVNIKDFVQAREPPMKDFSKRYMSDEAYKTVAVDNMFDIVRNDVAAVTVNPVFGSLWRTICNDRLNPGRDKLIEEFGFQVDKIANVEKKASMKIWLEESYNYAAELLEIILSVPEEEKYPCIFLDPTIEFKRTAAEAGEDDDDEAAKDPTNFTRAELLEIGRSCAYPILRRMGRVLTRLTYAATAEDVPAHIASEDQEKVPRIPLALVQEKHRRKFWKVLLHTILPGTMITARPAALLAALSLRMGIQHLRNAADQELLHFPNWNSLDIPETWNTNCLALVLDADANYEARVKDGITQRPAPDAVFLTAEDRRLFNSLVDYKLLEMNLNTSLTARVGWRPEKTKSAMGPVVKCKICHFPRSVTVMAADGVCGFCVECDCPSDRNIEEMTHHNVTTDDGATTQINWVECGVTSCRAQYVVYNPQLLNVRAKCFYCRTSGQTADNADAKSTAPFLECKTCTSRVIYPVEYRPSDLDIAVFTCSACDAGVKTIVDTETSATALMKENGIAWLLRNDDNKIAEPFTNRSLFHTISTAGTDLFADKVSILPSLTTAPNLTLRGKPPHNTSALLAELHRWVTSRRAQGDTCSLCFSTLSRRALHPACGRRGCEQRICEGCRDGWFGLNMRGKTPLNIAALNCPFCRRQPTPKALSKYNLTTLGGLREAVEDSGAWIYGWCFECGFAKQYMERVCANGPPAEIWGWCCEGCEEVKGQKGGLKIKECPGCGVTVQKISGCDHIECTCGTHWCFFCGEKVGQDVIYDHMQEAHGGYYNGAWSESEEDESDSEAEENGDDELGELYAD